MNNLTTFYLVRHGQTEWNVKGIVQGGTTDSPLTENGINVSRELAKKFKNIKFDLVFSSDLLRAKRTAEIIVLERELAVKTSELLRERSFGDFDGKPFSHLKEVHDLILKLNESERYAYKHSYTYESDEELTNRFLTFVREVAIAYPNKKILVVSHGSFIRTALMRMGFGDYSDLHPGSVTNGGWVMFQSDGVDFFIKETSGIKKIYSNDK